MIRSTFLAIVLSAGVANACPMCASGTGDEVRDGIRQTTTPKTIASLGIPVAAVLGVGAMIYFGGGKRHE